MRLEGRNFQFHPPQPQGKGGEWSLDQSPMAHDLINRAYVMKPP